MQAKDLQKKKGNRAHELLPFRKRPRSSKKPQATEAACQAGSQRCKTFGEAAGGGWAAYWRCDVTNQNLPSVLRKCY